MNKAGDPVGEIGKAESADAEELVRGKARDVRAPLFRGQDSVRRMLDSVNIDINVRIDLSGPAADLFRLVDIAGNIGGRHAAQESGILVDQAQDRVCVYAAGLLIDARDPQFHSVDTAVEPRRVEHRGVLQHRGHDVRPPCVFRDHPDHFHRDLRSRIAGIDRAALRAENDFFDIFAPPVLESSELAGDRIGMLGGVRHAVDQVEDFLRFFQAQRASRIVKKEPLSAVMIFIHIVELPADLIQLFFCEHSASVCIHYSCPSIAAFDHIVTDFLPV